MSTDPHTFPQGAGRPDGVGVSAVIVLAAGGGTRMKSRTSKLLHRVAGRPMLSYAVQAAGSLEPDRLVVVVGHEPTISVLAHILHDTDDDLASQISFGVPTATAVVIDVPCRWAELEPKSARIREIFTARKRD